MSNVGHKGQSVASNRAHHASKRNRFTIVFAREEDATNARSFRVAPWLLVVTGSAGALVIGIAFYLVVTLTPIATLIPLPNPALENKFGGELLSLNQRVMAMMEEMVQLRAYNVKLRTALGERLPAADSIVAAAELPNVRQQEHPEQHFGMDAGLAMPAMGYEGDHPSPVTTIDRSVAVAFPAILPAQGYITRGYGPEENHYGLDIAAKVGTLVSASADGSVIYTGWTEEDGNVLILAHGGGFVTVYKHNQSVLRAVGAQVKRGEAIATVGNTGRTSLGPHLHFEIWKDGQQVDPAHYVINLAL